ncbi:DsbA family protein [Corynebacterium alimapuense]|uniref:Thioredoxin-like fold domain-containing protein n=1 Tax=Corynebacterium alimapuense TaxID=1576874 RepID=A0A3M8KB14_9CORY|nr:thioredoxin domain-containing protein [Corynebacterium alimapuense]RNE49712.1 hypothetical protein C5L39_05120 [Corynebacterium alimapuense]
MSTSNKVSDPNSKGGSGFLWAIVAVVAIAAIVIGYIVWSSQGAKTEYVADREVTEVTFSAVVDDNAVTLAADDVAADVPTVDLFEDYSCHYCSLLAEQTDEQMQEAIEAGELVVNIRTMNFLDQTGTDGHSTMAAAAVLATADSGDAELFWNYRTLLLEDQEDIYNQWSNEDFAEAAAQLGASDEVAEAIRSGEYQEQAEDLTASNIALLDEETGEVSSPRVLQDGQDVDVEDISQWMDVVLAS